MAHDEGVSSWDSADPRPAPTTFHMTATLAPCAGSAALLRLVSILHCRCSQVRTLDFDADGPDGPTVSAEVTLNNTEWSALRELLARPVEVVDVATDGRTTARH